MTLPLLPIVVCIVGLVLALASKDKKTTIGLVCFAVGLLVTLLSMANVGALHLK